MQHIRSDDPLCIIQQNYLTLELLNGYYSRLGKGQADPALIFYMRDRFGPSVDGSAFRRDRKDS